MTLKDFAVNYLNPYYLLYRVVIVFIAINVFFFLLPSVNKGIMVLIGGFILAIILIKILKYRWFILYFAFPVAAFSLYLYNANSYMASLIGVSGFFILLWNGIRPWSGGVSINDINNKLRKYDD